MLEFAIGASVIIGIIVIILIFGAGHHLYETKNLKQMDFVECLENGVKVIIVLAGITVIFLVTYVLGSSILDLLKQ